MAIRGPYIIPRLSSFYWHLSGLYTFGRQNIRQHFPGSLMRYNRSPRPAKRRRKKAH
jgi:hypothetical protein